MAAQKTVKKTWKIILHKITACSWGLPCMHISFICPRVRHPKTTSLVTVIPKVPRWSHEFLTYYSTRPRTIVTPPGFTGLYTLIWTINRIVVLTSSQSRERKVPDSTVLFQQPVHVSACFGALLCDFSVWQPRFPISVLRVVAVLQYTVDVMYVF